MAEIIGKYDTSDLAGFLPNGETPVGGEIVRVQDNQGINGAIRLYDELIECGRKYIGRNNIRCPAVGGRDGSRCNVIVYRPKGSERVIIFKEKTCGQRLTRKAIRLIMPDKIPVLPLPEK